MFDVMMKLHHQLSWFRLNILGKLMIVCITDWSVYCTDKFLSLCNVRKYFEKIIFSQSGTLSGCLFCLTNKYNKKQQTELKHLVSESISQFSFDNQFIILSFSGKNVKNHSLQLCKFIYLLVFVVFMIINRIYLFGL